MDLSKGRFILFGGAGDGHDDFAVAADEMIALSGRRAPAFLFVGFAQLEPHHGFEYYGELFAAKGCRVDYLTDDDLRDGGAKRKIDEADIIFIMGGNTRKLVETLNAHGVSEMLRDAAARGAVMTGFSAGEICLCRAGMSKDEDYYMQDGIGCLDLYCCPHPLTSPKRYEKFRRELGGMPGAVGVAFDGAGLEIADGKYRALVFCPDGYMANICRPKDCGIEDAPVGGEWRPVGELFG